MTGRGTPRGAPAGAAALLLALVLSGCSGPGGRVSSGPSSGGGTSVPPAAPGPTTDEPLPWDPEAAGRRVDDLVRADGSSWSSLRTVLVSRDGRLVLERHYGGGPDRPRDVSAVTTTVVGTLAGIAVRQGLLGLDDRLSRMDPAHADAMGPVVGAVTLRQLLTMQSGLPADPLRATRPWFVGTPSWAGSIVARGLEGTPTQFAYTSASAQLVATAVRRATGETLADYARRELFGPLGITRRVAWPVSPTGEDVAFGRLGLTAADLLRLGELYLDGGTAGGRRVLGPAWVRASTRDQQFELDPGGSGYGYLWWVRDVDGHRTYAALGEGQQVLEVVPDLGLVIVAVGDLDPDYGLDGPALQRVLDDALLAGS